MTADNGNLVKEVESLRAELRAREARVCEQDRKLDELENKLTNQNEVLRYKKVYMYVPILYTHTE